MASADIEFIKEGGKLAMYLQSGKFKHDRWFWLEGDHLSWDKKKKAPGKANKVQRWLLEVGRRLTGVPRFVLKDAQLIYRKALKEPKRQGCTEQGARPPAAPPQPRAFSFCVCARARAPCRPCRPRGRL